MLNAGGLTTSTTTFDVLAEKPTTPVYCAVMLCEPTLRLLVEYVATPEDRVAVPSKVVPSKNETDPVGVPAELLTVAEKVTLA